MRMMLLALGLGSMLAAPLQAQEVDPPQAVAAAQDPVPPTDGIRTEATVVVTGEQPGPGLWLVRKGDHELWILGTLNPLPAGMQWQARQVEQVIASAQEVIRPPRVTFTIGEGESVGLVGESGCGKSTLARLVTRTLDPTDGDPIFRGRNIGFIPARAFAGTPFRPKIQMVVQDASDSRWDSRTG